LSIIYRALQGLQEDTPPTTSVRPTAVADSSPRWTESRWVVGGGIAVLVIAGTYLLLPAKNSDRTVQIETQLPGAPTTVLVVAGEDSRQVLPALQQSPDEGRVQDLLRAKNQALIAAQTQLQAQAQVQTVSKQLAQQQAAALAQAQRQLQTQAQVQAQAQVLARDQAQALVAAQAQLQANAQAQEQTQRQAQDQAEAAAQIQIQLQAQLQAQTDAELRTQDQAKALASAQRQLQSQALVQNHAQVRAQQQVQSLALAEAQVLAQAQALAEIQLQLQAQEDATAQARAQAQKYSQVQAQLRAQGQALAQAQAELQAHNQGAALAAASANTPATRELANGAQRSDRNSATAELAAVTVQPKIEMQAVVADANAVRVLRSQIINYARNKQIVKARQALETLRLNVGDNSQFLLRLSGFVESSDGQLDKAYSFYQQVLVNDSTDLETHYNAGLIAVKLQNYASAREHLRQSANNSRYMAASQSLLAALQDRGE